MDPIRVTAVDEGGCFVWNIPLGVPVVLVTPVGLDARLVEAVWIMDLPRAERTRGDRVREYAEQRKAEKEARKRAEAEAMGREAW